MARCFLFPGKLVTWGPFRLLVCLVKQLVFNLVLSESILICVKFPVLFKSFCSSLYGCAASVLSSKR